MSRSGAAGLAIALCACGGTLFVDPTPPRLRKVTAQYTTSAVAEPLVFLPMLDLYIEEPGSCAPAKSFLLDALLSALEGTVHLQLSTQDLAPECTQREEVRLDVDGIVAVVKAVSAVNPAAHVRPVLIYANNVALPLPQRRSQELAALSAKLLAQQGMPPVLWLVSSKAISLQLPADGATDWTYAGDPAMATAMRAFAQQALPLQTELGTVSPSEPLVNGADLATARQAKLCVADPAATVTGLAAPGVASPIDRANPPRWQISLPPQAAALKHLFSLHTVIAKVELCDGHCDRYYRIDPDQLQHGWDVTKGCLLPGTR